MFRIHARVIAATVLCFFTWTSGGLFSVAHAAVDGVKKSNAAPSGKQEGAEEKFARLTEDLRLVLADPKTAAVTKREKLVAARAELETIDPAIRAGFAATEKKLKDARLPAVILERHARFVKHYDENLNELKMNIDGAEKAKDDAGIKAGVELVLAHLEKTKAPSRHQKLDPNNLPHRQPKALKREPRLKKEEFDEDLKKDKHAWKSAKRIMVASTGSLTGLLPPDDLAETVEVQLTPEIRAKAAELGNSPVRIYEWVRNSIDYQAYYGALKSAPQTFIEGAGNDFDQASLLIALLRASNIAAKYVYGTVEIPIEKIMSWLGNVTDPYMAVTMLATQGIPIKIAMAGGTIKAVQIEHVWVSAWIDYNPSRGTVHKQGNTWIPLDPSFKQYTAQKGMNMYSLMGFNAEQFLESYIRDPRDVTAYQDYGKRLVDYVDTNLPNATIEDVFGASAVNQSRSIVVKEYSYFLGTLPYKVITKAGQFSGIPSPYRYSIGIQVEGDEFEETAGLNYSGWLSTLSDKRVTLSYEPATADDESLVVQYGGMMLAVPPYLLNVKPVLKINGVTVASGAAIGLGIDQNLVVNFTGADGDVGRVQHVITAGDYSAIILTAQKTPSSVSSKNIVTLFENAKGYNAAVNTIDDLLGQMLYAIGNAYFYHIGFENDVYSKSLQLEYRHQPSETLVKHGISVNYIFGIPRTVSEGNVNIDVARNINSIFSPMHDKEREKTFAMLSGLSASAWESKILEVFFDIPSVSAVRLLKLASEKNIPLNTIDSTNIIDALPQLRVGAAVKDDIENAVSAGNIIIIPQSEVTYNQWVGTGYIVINPDTGAAGYMISGGLAGGGTSKTGSGSLRAQSAFSMLANRSFWGQRIVFIAKAFVGTPYVWGGKEIETGVDCSGFVHEVHEVAGIYMPKGNAKNQYNLCTAMNWSHPYSERLEGDIMWNQNLSHVGIEAGINTVVWPPNQETNTTITGETIVHASGRPCYPTADDAPKGTPKECIIKDCELIDPVHPKMGGNPSCGKFNEVIESPPNYFSKNINSNVCRPN
jgi:cell wall-associated NlpC family hydrolase/transglutaminase-like putative cysteine protease